VPFGSGRRPYIEGSVVGPVAGQYLGVWGAGACCSLDAARQLFSRHEPANERVDPRGLVMLLREPRQRLLSSFYDGLHVGPAGTVPAGPQQLYSQVTCPGTFARFEGVANCQTKMLLGCQCGSSCGGLGVAGSWTAAHDSALREAKRVIDGARFVGLTEEFELSVRLFHHATDGAPADASELARVRVGVTSGAAAGAWAGYDLRELDTNHTRAWSPKQPWRACAGAGVTPGIRWDVPSSQLEELDRAVYAHARQRFRRAAEEAGLLAEAPGGRSLRRRRTRGPTKK
jgi:hypothetical protein